MPVKPGPPPAPEHDPEAEDGTSNLLSGYDPAADDPSSMPPAGRAGTPRFSGNDTEADPYARGWCEGSDADRPAGGPGDDADGGTEDDEDDRWLVDPAADSQLEPGQDFFNGEYRLIQKLGHGGMGEVWLALHKRLEHRRALKVIKPEIAREPNVRVRFEREARLMAKIHHPNAVVAHRFELTDQWAFIEMEYVRGQTLKQILTANKNRPLALEGTARILAQLCAVLQVAHEHVDDETDQRRPIIHRDLKPSNLMLVAGCPDDRNLKVLDFGIAKIMSADGPEFTSSGEYFGTAAYSSPEQFRGGDNPRAVDARSDLYSVGVILYQLLTGALPFTQRGSALMAAHLEQSPRPMKEANPAVSIPPAVEKVVRSCLEKNRARRPADAAELNRLFRAAVDASKPGARRWTHQLLIAAALLGLTVTAVQGGREVWKRYGRPATVVGPVTPPVPPVVPGKSGPVDTPKQPSTVTTPPVEVARVEPRTIPPSEVTPPPVAAEEPLARPAEAPEGYQWAEWKTNGPDGPARRLSLVRDLDKARFRYADGVFLPEGYEAEDPNDLLNGWPRVLAREGGARFIRVAGNTYRRGPWTLDLGLNEGDSKPIWVKVSDFYIQETEVTNREIDAYWSARPGVPELSDWKRLMEILEARPGGRAEALDGPAGCISWTTATAYAAWVGGRLPTESEWEYAARSKGLDRLWATGPHVKHASELKAHLLPNAQEQPFAVAVKTFKNDDRTDQGIFDMTGNVREWCLDGYREYTKLELRTAGVSNNPLRDPRETPVSHDKPRYVVRGGSFLVGAGDAYTFRREGVEGVEKIGDLGFRVVIETPPAVAAK